MNARSNAAVNITQMAAVMLITLIHPSVIIEKITNPGRKYVKQAFGEYLLLFSNKWFPIRKKGTNEHKRIRPGHQSVHASPDKAPPQTESAERVYLFIQGNKSQSDNADCSSQEKH